MRLGVTPVLIPNTMVKTQAADGTALETMWESRWMPGSIKAMCGASRMWRTNHIKVHKGPGCKHCVLTWSYPRQGGHRTIIGGVAQLGEHLPCKQGVMSSNLTISTKVMKRMSGAYGQSRANAFMQMSPGMYGREGIRRIPVMSKREAVANPADM